MKLYKDYVYLTPMKYYNNEDNQVKRAVMIDNINDDYIALEKYDGEWSMLAHFGPEENYIRGRGVSKGTGLPVEHTEKLPQIVAAMETWPAGTIVLAELCWPGRNTQCNDVGSILRCNTDKALLRQKDNPLHAVIFDVLAVDGEIIQDVPFEKRIEFIPVIKCASNGSPYIHQPHIYYTDFAGQAAEIIGQGGEGLVIQHRQNTYVPGERKAWKTLKVKRALEPLTVPVVGVLEPEKIYNGNSPDWPFKRGDTLVTKPYFYGWKNGIKVTCEGNVVEVASGLTDEDREWLAMPATIALIERGEVYAEITAMDVSVHGKLRHPVLVRLRLDLGE